MPEERECRRLVALVKKAGLRKTQQCIEGGGNGLDIIYMLASEAGSDTAIQLIAQLGSAKLAGDFASYVPNLTKVQWERLFDIVAGGKDPIQAYWFARNAPNLTEAQMNRLVDIVEKEVKDPFWACEFVLRVSNLTEAQVNRLVAVVSKSKDPNLAEFFICSAPNLTEGQKAQLVKVIRKA